MSTIVVPPVPLPTPEPEYKGILRRALKGFLTAITSSAAVKGEKNLAVVVVTGVLVAAGASDGLVNAVTALVNAL